MTGLQIASEEARQEAAEAAKEARKEACERTEHGDRAVAPMREARDCGRPFVAAILDLTIPGVKGRFSPRTQKKHCPIESRMLNLPFD